MARRSTRYGDSKSLQRIKISHDVGGLCRVGNAVKWHSVARDRLLGIHYIGQQLVIAPHIARRLHRRRISETRNASCHPAADAEKTGADSVAAIFRGPVTGHATREERLAVGRIASRQRVGCSETQSERREGAAGQS